MNFIAKIRTLTASALSLPVHADDLSAALRDAGAACDRMRASHVDVQLLRIEDTAGKTLLSCDTTNPLPAGYTDVVWRARFATDDHEEAACLARIARADPASPLSVFELRTSDGRTSKLDLQSTSCAPH